MRTRRAAGTVVATVLLALVVATGASAQTPPPDPTTTTAPTTTTTRPPTTTTAPATTTTTAPPPAQTPGTTSNPTPRPGETVPVNAPPRSGDPVLDTEQPIAAVLVPASGAADVPVPHVTATLNANGSVTVSVVIPEGTPPGVYFVAIVGTDANGNSRTIIVPIVVRRVVTAAGVSAADPASFQPAASTVEVPASVRALQASLSEAEVAEAETAVLEDGATLVIEGERLVVSRPSTDDSTRPLIAAAAVALVGGSLIAVRRRPATRKVAR
ncbi:MAG TPA: hypothetical protein VM262_06880 [Acidimicrobiales bacterium]|nr:hypothetical protein [Acidimicrobiales bacterium]